MKTSSSNNYLVGIDLGGTKIEGILLEKETARQIKRIRIPTEQNKGYQHILNQIKKLVLELTAKLKSHQFSIGIGTPGSISPETGLIRNSNTLCLNGKPLQQDLEKILGQKIKIENDANCFAIAESLWGNGQGQRLVFGVIMGTGCGGGIVYQGKIWKGRNGIGGEWGHSQIKQDGEPCYCGKRGCIETFISGSGVEKQYYKLTGQKLSFKEITTLFREKDKNATFIIEEFLENFGRALSNVINILDPDIIVLGGGLSNFELLYTEGRKRVEKYVFSDSFTTPIVKNKLGDSAGVIGAAFL